MCFTRVFDDVEQMPFAVANGCQVAQQFIVALEQGLVARQLVTQNFIWPPNSACVASDHWHEAVTR